jgi:guanylate kinase
MAEHDGKDYYFYSKRQFQELEEKKKFIETNPFATGHRYGTLLAELERAQKEGKILIVDCEVNGAISIFNKYPESTFPIFLDGDDHVVQKRLENSGTRKRDKIPERIKNLQEQRVTARESGIFKLNWDTSRMNELFVFNIIETVLLEEIRYRKHFKHL